ncbi:MAG: class I SAM-dependent methyltransferase [candidate division Zixibacteria bacterium]|nr:class I SAM-dependent methyltransferase [candidate division Zixibacteria bacterium]
MTGSPQTVPFDVPALLDRFDSGSRLSFFHDLLMAENKRINLVSRETSRDSFDRMVAECLLPLTVLNSGAAGGAYLDIGAGGGFPLFPIALTGRTASLHACERTQKKAAALVRIARDLGLAVTVIPRTFEDIRFERTFALVTLRYVTLTATLLSGVLSVLDSDGVFVYYSDPPFAVDRAGIRRFRFQSAPDQPFKHFCLITRE